MKKTSQFLTSFFKIIFLCGIICLGFCISSCTQKQNEYSQIKLVLGTVCNIRILTEKNPKEADEILEDVFNEIYRLERILNANCEKIEPKSEVYISELESVNQMAGIQPVAVSDDLYSVIKIAMDFAEKTDGAFNPAIGPLVKLWDIGFENSSADDKTSALTQKKSLVPSQEEISKLLPLLNYNDIILTDKTVFLPKKGMRLDLGGIAKGYIADCVKSILVKAKIKNALIDLGGNIFALGKNPRGNNWRLGIKNPNIGSTNSVMTLELTEKSLVTSGNYERYFIEDGILYHHILDSKTGYPAKPNLNAVSIMCDKSVYCDALSTALFVLDSEKGCKLLSNLPDLGASAFFFFKDNTILPVIANKEKILPFTITDTNFKEK